MNCDHVRAVLLGEAPHTDTSDHVDGCPDCQRFSDELDALDARFADLIEIEPPMGLLEETLAAVDAAFDADWDAPFAALPSPMVPSSVVEQTLSAVDAEMLRDIPPAANRWWRWASIAVAAAAVLLVVSPLGSPPDPDRPMREKGDGIRLPELALKVSVSHDGTLSRYRAGQAYTVGDVLYFRASADTTGHSALVRVDGKGAVVIHQQDLPAMADADLRMANGKLLAWEIEAGEQTAAFALLSGPTPLTADAVEGGLSGVSPEAVCQAAAA
ncbi:MAG: hypothetical protein AAFV53_37090, partial [Myxococcota bacterium]